MCKFRTSSLMIPLLLFVMAVSFGCSDETADTGEADQDQTTLADTVQIESLQAKLDARNRQFAQKAPAEMIELFESGVDSVRASGVLETAINTGDTIPMFSLPDPHGDTVSIAELLEDGPVVIAWYRGNW